MQMLMRLSTAATAVILAAFALPGTCVAQIYAADLDCGCVYSYVDTTATPVTPSGLTITQVGALSLDHEGNILIAGLFTPSTYVCRLDPDTADYDLIFAQSLIPGYHPVGIQPDEGDDIYVLMRWGGSAAVEGRDPTPNDFIALLPDGAGPPSVAFTFPSDLSVIDMKVRPPGANEGNVLVMCEDTVGGGSLFVELERTQADTFTYVGSIADGGMMPPTPMAFDFTPYGTINIIDYDYGLYYVDEDYGYVWGFGSTMDSGMSDMSIDSNGYIYLANVLLDRVRRYSSDGLPAGPVFGSDLHVLRAITVAGYTPTPEGEMVLVEPWEEVEVTFEGIAEAGFTTAVVEETSSRVSPVGGNHLPAHAALPTNADSFTYVSLATDAVYTDGLQVDVLMEGSRLFFASGYADTFRDFTVVGSIEDARGTIPRFSEFPAPLNGRADTDPTEVVLVEDTRSAPEVTAYKFWRLERALATPDTVPFCPWGAIHGLKAYVTRARGDYDGGLYASAIAELASMNEALRGYAGTCIPNSSAAPLNDRVGRILGHSKTLMFSIDVESWSGVEEAPSTVSLAVLNPSRGECRMALTGPAGTDVAVRLYDVAGRRVATLYEGTLPEGGAEVVWDGTDPSGHRAASGVYFARAEAGGELASSKVVYLK